MSKIKSVLIILLSFITGGLAFNSIKPVDIKDIVFLPPKNIIVSGEYVTLDGTWLPQNSSENNFFREKEVNTSSVDCDKQLQVCTETRGVVTQLDSGSGKYGFYTHNFVYQIKDWTDSYLRAELVGTGRVFDLTINLTNKTAILNIKDNPDNLTASAYTDTAILGN